MERKEETLMLDPKTTPPKVVAALQVLQKIKEIEALKKKYEDTIIGYEKDLDNNTKASIVKKAERFIEKMAKDEAQHMDFWMPIKMKIDGKEVECEILFRNFFTLHQLSGDFRQNLAHRTGNIPAVKKMRDMSNHMLTMFLSAKRAAQATMKAFNDQKKREKSKLEKETKEEVKTEGEK